MSDGEWVNLGGLPVTQPSRIASDLLRDREDPEAIAQIITEAIRRINYYPSAFADALAPRAASYGYRRGDGLALLRWLLDLSGDPDRNKWVDQAQRDPVTLGAKT